MLASKEIISTHLRMDKITEPGFYEMEAEDYHADPCAVPSLSRGIAHTLIAQSPAHARAEHPRLNILVTDTPSKAMEFGDVAHQLLLGKGSGFAVYTGDDWRGNDAKRFKENARNDRKTPILERERDRAQRMVDIVQDRLAHRGLEHAFTGHQNELVAIWKEDDIWCRCMMDGPRFDHGVIYDFKTTTSAHPAAIAKKMTEMAIDMQSIWYPRGVVKLKPELAGRLKQVTVFAEVEWPHAVTTVELNGEFIQLAESKVERAVALWRQCMNSKTWPEYSEAILRIGPKPWDMVAEEAARNGGPIG